MAWPQRLVRPNKLGTTEHVSYSPIESLMMGVQKKMLIMRRWVVSNLKSQVSKKRLRGTYGAWIGLGNVIYY